MSFFSPEAVSVSPVAPPVKQTPKRNRTPAVQAALGKSKDAILSGAIRDMLGLTNEDLKLGLEVAANRLQRGAHRDALRIYAALVLCEPTNVAFQIGLANCALLLHENCLALQAASFVITSEPKNARGYLLSGRACLGLGCWKEAEEDLRRASELAKQNRDANLYASAEALMQKLRVILAR